MSRPGLNAASRPFYNSRPVQRIVLGLWTAGAVLMVLNGWLYWRAWTGQSNRQDEIVELETRIAERQQREKAIESAVAGLEVDFLNEQVLYLNAKLAERTFGWSSLFERLSDVLPNDVRLHQLAPRFTGEEEDDLQYAFAGDRISLQLTGAAKSDDSVLEFIDALFKHPSFKRPSIQTESKTDRGEINWTLSVMYLPLADSAEPSASDAVVSEDPESTGHELAAQKLEAEELEAQEFKAGRAPAAEALDEGAAGASS